MQEGSQIIVTEGPHKGHRGRVVLTPDGKHRLVAALLRLPVGWARVALDGTDGGDVTVRLAELAHADAAPPAMRLETDAELRVRMAGALTYTGGKPLDAVARLLHLERQQVPL